MMIELLAIGGLLLIYLIVKGICEFSRKRIEAKEKRIDEILLRLHEGEEKEKSYLQPEEDFSEEMNESQGLPSSAIQDAEDEDEE